MYPNSALSAGQLAIIAVIPVLCLAIWLVGVFVATRGAARAAPVRHHCRSIKPMWKNLSVRPPDCAQPNRCPAARPA